MYWQKRNAIFKNLHKISVSCMTKQVDLFCNYWL